MAKYEEFGDLSLEDRVLMNLSYLSPMRFEEIILDFDSDFLATHPEFDRETLMKILDQLVKQKKVKLIKGSKNNNKNKNKNKNEDYQWQRIYPRKRSLWDWLPWRKK